jgi:hypothetical protein
MGRRKGEMSPAQLDRDYPFQVALPADRVAGKNHPIIEGAVAALGGASRTHTVRRDDRTYVVYCFLTKEDAHGFSNAFDGEPFDPRDRGRRRHWYQWKK